MEFQFSFSSYGSLSLHSTLSLCNFGMNHVYLSLRNFGMNHVYLSLYATLA